MSTSGRAGKPARQPAAEANPTPSGHQPGARDAEETYPPDTGATGTSPGGGQASDAVTAEAAVEADSQPAAEEGPVDEAELRQEIERTREQLGETVEQLAAKTDVKGRARAKAAELAGRAKSTTAQVRTQATTQAGSVRGQLAGKAAMTRHKLVEAGGTAKTQLQAGPTAVREATPEPVRRAVAKGSTAAQQQRVPLAMAAVTLIAGYAMFRWWRKR